ncbi:MULTISPECIES: hypothetical protein [Ramlibacter]|uniref:DUF4124 domain-containing protein n=1 Tax=Ramlibacter aquaticus TaxID=2780094 RepID=A0ABR9SEX9_9BURK|nr:MULTISPECIES: hypothetical protein [Ramlibacter]MBE7940916.1 hypothetical protein [Ramlibacter aquaticus]
MKHAVMLALAAAAAAAGAQAQTKVWRCGNTYTNSAIEAQAQGCKPLEGGNITVVQGTKPNASAVAAGAATRIALAPPQAGGGQRIDAADQKARDSDARQILEDELRKAQARQAELLKDYNNGEPEMLGPEHRNHQKYLDRVADMKASIARTESDIAGIKRELARIASK